MSEQRIKPEKITKPLQLLAAWLVGLILVNGSFLVAAQQITKPDWASGVLVVAAIINVPIFLVSLFLLQTKFRPQMQEDQYYSQYLERERYQSTSTPNSSSAIVEQEVVQTTERLVRHLNLQQSVEAEPIADLLRQSQQEILLHKYGTTRTLSELFVAPESWSQISTIFKSEPAFISDMEGMLSDGLIERINDDYGTAKLTSSGSELAKKAEKLNMLFSQAHDIFWANRLDNVK